MTFDANDPRITAYVLDELLPEDRAQFEAQMAASPELQAAVRETRDTISALEHDLAASTNMRLTTAQRDAVQAEVANAGESKTRASRAVPAGMPVESATRGQKVQKLIAGYGAVAAILLIGSMLLLPSVQSSREASRSTMAKNRLLAEAWRKEEARRSANVRQHDLQTLFEIEARVSEGDIAFVIAPNSLPKNLPQGVQPDPDHGTGPGMAGDRYDLIVENDFLGVLDAPLSTFSIDVDTASYAKVRMYLKQHGQMPRPDAVRIEELINYFPYNYAPPTGDDPFAAHLSAATCPWKPAHKLVRIALQGQQIEQDQRPPSNLVFLLDVSGSMNQPNKLPLLKRGMKMLVDQLLENDRVAIVVYAGAAGLVLDSTTGDNKLAILSALDLLEAGGSTNGGDGIHLAYQQALDHFIPGGVNRVILCTDGDFNVGTTGTDELVRVVERHAKSDVFLSVLGFGMGNHNDSMLEQISNKGNGNYAFVDTDSEARKVLVEQISATLVTIAKDVKIQVEFNPAKVAAYRLIGYENRILAAQDFNDDTKDAGEIGAGHSVTALYEIIPNGADTDIGPNVDPLKYQSPPAQSNAAESDELLTVKLRYKQPNGDTSKLLTFPLADSSQSFHRADRDFQFAAAVASFGMLLRDSKYKGDATYASVEEIASAAASEDTSGYRREFLALVRKASQLAGEPVQGL